MAIFDMCPVLVAKFTSSVYNGVVFCMVDKRELIKISYQKNMNAPKRFVVIFSPTEFNVNFIEHFWSHHWTFIDEQHVDIFELFLHHVEFASIVIFLKFFADGLSMPVQSYKAVNGLALVETDRNTFAPVKANLRPSNFSIILQVVV